MTKGQTNICVILSVQLVAVLVIAAAIFWYTVSQEEQSIEISIDHGEQAVGSCFDQYLTSIQSTGEDFVTDISHTIYNHVTQVVDEAERMAVVAADAIENTNYMSAMEQNEWHGTVQLPLLAWMLLGPLDSEISADVVVAGFNSTEEYNHWVWFGLAERNPNKELGCDFYYYRNATALTSELWCVDDLYADPSHPSPSVYPHLYSPAIVRLQDAVLCERDEQQQGRSLLWMPLDFFVWTLNVFPLTSVVTAIHSPQGECVGLVAANVRFSSMSAYVAELVNTSRYDDLNVALIETTSEKILGTSLGKAIYAENQTRVDGTTVEQELAASLQQMQHSPLAVALDAHITEQYGSLAAVPTPLIETARLLNEEVYFISYDTFARPDLNLTIISFLPVLSITDEAVQQRLMAQDQLYVSQEELEDDTRTTLIIVLVVGTVGLVACAVMSALTAGYLHNSIQRLVQYMDNLKTQISTLSQKSKSTGAATINQLCEPLPDDFFPNFPDSRLSDLNNISAATHQLTQQLLETWNAKQDVFKQALDQRQFTAMIAHDIRNPLHGMLGIVGMMQSDFEGNKEKLPLLADTCAHMAVLLNDMVDLSKIQGGKVTHAEKRFDCGDVLEEVVTLYKDKVARSGGTLSYQRSNKTQLPLAYSDPVHVQRIMTNFVSNAAKYATGCAIELKAVVATKAQVLNLQFLQDLSNLKNAPVWAENADLDGDQYLILACQDHGRGIPEDKLSNVFDAYQQTAPSDRYNGAGLGLAIVKGLATELGGGIGVQSAVAEGSLFWLVVTCRSDSPDQKSPLDRHMALGSELSNSTASTAATCLSDQGYTILVVDDTKLNLTLAKHFLTKLGLSSVVSLSGPDALQKLRQDPDKFALVLSDFHMPEMTGGELCLEIRNDPILRNLPFICSSGNHLTDQEKERYKMDESLLKPFTLKLLQETLEPVLGHPSKWAETQEDNPPEAAATPMDESTSTSSTTSKNSMI